MSKIGLHILLTLLVFLTGCRDGGARGSDAHTVEHVDFAQKFQECPPGDEICDKDRIGFEAIRHLHHQIDDDRNGNLDRSESDEFIRDELKYEDGFDRHTHFHGDDDLISVDDLWKLWIQSEVYNWTVDDVVDWVTEHVELPQYVEHVRVNAVDGHTLPRIAGNPQYVINILGIKNPVHRQKMSLKAMDLVLFGAPKRHNYIKDLVLVGSLLIACGGCWLAYIQNRYSQNHLRKVMKDLETLRKAEEAFTQLQQELEDAQQHKDQVEKQKQTLEVQMKGQINQARDEAERLRVVRESTEEEISRLRLAEEELLQVRSVLKRTEKELDQARSGMPLAELQSWLQLTYEIETTHYDKKREAAERQLLVAKEMCEKIRKKRSAFLGSLRVAHTTSIDDTDHMIMSARAALEEMKMDLQERTQRWQNIESICGFPIMQNPGQICLEALLRSAGHAYSGGSSSLVSSRALSGSMVAPLNVEDADEDLPPGSMTGAAAFYSVPPSVHRGYPAPHHVFTDPGMFRPEPRVWPHLMKAGMQLTMFGLGLTNPQAMHSSNQLSLDKRSSSLASTLGGSQSSMTSLSSRSRPPLSTIPSQDTDTERETDSDNSATGSTRTSVGSTNGAVSFHLGSPTTETLTVADDNRERANSFGRYRQSVSADGSTTRRLPRPKTLPSSLSEGSFKGLPVNPGGISPRHKKTHPSRTPTPSIDDTSSPESLDGSIGEREKKKKKKNMLSKFLGREKNKAS